MENNVERIDRYLSGQMNAEEQKAFDAEVETNPQLAEALGLQQDMTNFLRRKDQRAALKNQLQHISKDYFESAPRQEAKVVPLPRRRMRWIALTAAAAAVVALLLVWQFLLSPSLFDQYAQYPPLALAEKSATSATDWSQTETAFNTGDYASAATQLTQYLKAYPNDHLAKLYLGISKMELNQLAEAQQIFQSFSNADASIKDYADWYLALSYLKEKDTETAQKQLKQITPASPLFSKAQELLKKL